MHPKQIIVNNSMLSLLYALVMASIDTGMLGLVKDIHNNGSLFLMVVPTVVYALQPWIFLSAMKFESLTVMNLLWDLVSNVLVTLIGIFYFKELLSPLQMCGLVLGFISFLMLSYKG
jgi:multidrug transporter EmrE-like cation transporter